MSQPSDAKRKSRVVLVEDHPMFRERLAQVVGKDLAMEVAGEADNIESALRIIEDVKPDIVIADLSLKGSGGLELLKLMTARGVPTPVLMLSMHPEAIYAARALHAGARGYITKDEDSSLVIHAIRKVLSGGVYLSPKMTEKMTGNIARGAVHAEQSPIERLTDRELEVYRLFGLGSNTREIAEKLSLSENTICTHRQHIKEKLDVKNFTELYSRAARWVQEQGS